MKTEMPADFRKNSFAIAGRLAHTLGDENVAYAGMAIAILIASLLRQVDDPDDYWDLLKRSVEQEREFSKRIPIGVEKLQ